jgi:hypothetical protein
MIDDEQKKRIEAQASHLLEQASELGDDATEALASLYAAAQVIERELLGRGHLDLRQVAYVQVVGKRVGAAMTVAVDEEVIDPTIN